MKSPRGANLRAIPVEPNTEQSDAPPEFSPNQPDAVANNSAVDDLANLPDAPHAMPIQPHDSNAQANSDDDLDSLPDAAGHLGHVYKAVYHGDPDNVAKVLNTSDKLGADPAQVAASLKDASKAASRPDDNFFQAIEDRYPGTTKFLQVPRNMAIAHDDMPNVAQTESLIQKVKDAFHSGENALTGGALQEELSFSRYQQMMGETQPKSEWFRVGGMLANSMGAPQNDVKERANWIQGRLDEINKDRPQPEQSSWIKRGLYGATEFAPQLLSGAMTGVKYAAPLAGTVAAAGAILGPADIPPTLAAAGAGFALGEAEYNYRLMAGMAYDNMQKVKDVNGQPLPDDVMRIASIATGAAGAGLSLVKLDALLGPAGKQFIEKFTGSVPEKILADSATRSAALKTFAKEYVQSVAHGTGAMTAIAGANILGERGAEAASGQSFDHKGEPSIPSQLVQNAEDAAGTFAFMGGVSPAIGLHGDLQAAEKAKTAGDFYKAMGDTAEASKIRQRLPEAHQELIKDLVKDGPVENVFIPHEAFQSYFQSKNVDPEVVANELGINEAYQEAQKTGGDVKIPLDAWASKVAGTEHYQGLAGDIKFNSEDLTSNQVEERKAQIKEQIKQAEAEAQGEATPKSESAQKVYDERYQQLIDAGQTPYEARVSAGLHEAAFRNWGERTGIDPHELAEKFKLEIQNGESPGAVEGQAFNQTDDPQERTRELDRAFRSPDVEVRYNDLPESKNGQIISQDIARFLDHRYAKDKEGATIHQEATQKPAQNLADKLIKKKIDNPGHDPIVMTMGGTGSGKTTHLETYAKEYEGTPIFDSTGVKHQPMKDLIEQAREKGKPVIIPFVYNTFDKALEGNVTRYKETGRLVQPKVMAHTHVGALDTFLKLHAEYKDDPGVNFQVYDNSIVGKGEEMPTMSVDELAALRYNKDGQSVNAAARKLEKRADERLKNETAEAEALKEKANRDASRSNSSGEGDSSGDSGPQRQSSESFDQGGQSPLGRITFQDSKAIIHLFKDADRSTFLHETGHYFLQIMDHLSSMENADPQIKADMQAVRDWMGLKEGEEIGVPQHEQFARGFEAYLREGNAPSEVLRRTFQRFKQWLTQIYKSAKGLNVELSPEIRGVMDRMLATDEEIKNAHRAVGFDQSKGMEVPENIKAKMNDLAGQAREQAESTLMREQMKELSESNQKFLEEERQRLTIEGEEKAKNEPVFKAQNDIQEAIGKKKDVLTLAHRILDDKVKTRPDMQAAVQFEMGAQVNGFEDAKDLANAMLEADTQNLRQRMIDEHVSEGMRPHANLMDKSEIKLQALRAIHNDHMTELLALERQVFQSKVNEADVNQEVSRRQRIEARIQASEAKVQAKEILDGKQIRDAGNFRIYTTAERNAAIRADAAIKRKDFERAAEYKRQQMLNHALAAEAMRNRDEVESSVKQLQKAAKRGADLKDMPFAFNRQVDQLLERFGLKEKTPEDTNTLLQTAKDMQSKGETPDEIANQTGQMIDPMSGQFRPETLRDFINRVNNGFNCLQLPESIISGPDVSDYRDMKMADLRDLNDAVKTVTQIGKRHDRWLSNLDYIHMKDAAANFKSSVLENIGQPYAEDRKLGSRYSSPLREKIANLKNIPDGMISTMVNTLTTCTYLDGGEKNGPAHEYIYRPLKQAEDRKFARYAKMREELTGKEGLFGKFYSPKELSEYKKKATEVDGRSVTKENILAMALNWGNESNRDRIKAGFGSRDGAGRLVPMSDETTQGLFKHLGKKDWDFVQAAWDHLDTYWPEIKALEMKIKGVEPGRVEPAPFENEHGSFRGGYYPIAYDFEKSSEAFKNEQQKTELYKQYSASSAQTEKGHTIARTSFVARPVRLSLDVFFNHLENVIHDLEFRPAIIDVNKFMNMPDVKNTIENAIGQDAKRGMDNWLQSIASDQSENLTWFEKALTWTRFGTTISALGLTPKAFLLHLPSNIFNSMWETGAQNTVRMMTRASLDVAMGRGELKDFVFSRSERMKQRLTVRDRDIMDMSKAWQGKDAGIIPHYAFMSLHLADEAVSVPLWADVYKKNVAEFGEQKASDIADETVTRTLGSGSKVDQIGLQRGSQTKKLFTMFYSWMSVMFNRAWLDGKMAGLEYKQGNVGSAVGILAKASFFVWALPAVHEALLQQAMSSGQPTDEEREKRMLGTIIEHPFAMIPFVRDLAQPIIHTVMGEHGGDMKISPVETALQNIYKPVADGARIAFSDDKQFDEKFAEETARGLSQVAGYPQQLNTWAFNLLDYVQSNGEASMKSFLSRQKMASGGN